MKSLLGHLKQILMHVQDLDQGLLELQQGFFGALFRKVRSQKNSKKFS